MIQTLPTIFGYIYNINQTWRMSDNKTIFSTEFNVLLLIT